MSEHPQGSLSSNNEANPHEHPKAITLRSGKEVGIGSERMMEKENGPEIVIIESLVKEEDATLPVKEYVPHLPSHQD